MAYKTRSRAPKRIKDTNQVLFEYIPTGESKEVITFAQNDNTQLKSPNYLNDTIISFFMQYHLDNFVDEDLKKTIHVFSSFFLSKIKSIYKKQNKNRTVIKGKSDTCITIVTDDETTTETTTTNGNGGNNKCASRWLKGVKLFEKEFVFLPVCEDDHWLLVIVCYPKNMPSLNPQAIPDEKLTEPAVFVLNSMKAPAAGVKKVLQKFLADQWKLEKNSNRSFPINNAKSSGIRLLFPEVPQQKNNYNCGVYLLNYFKCFLESPRDSYIKMFRQRNMLAWFEENEIRIQSERARMIEIVKRQIDKWDTPENKVKRAAMESESQESLGSQNSQISSQNTIIEIN